MLLFCDLLLLVPHHLSRRWLFCCCSRERLINIEIIQQIGGIFNQCNQFARSDYAIYLFSSPTSFKVRNWWKNSSVLFSVPIAFTSSVIVEVMHIFPRINTHIPLPIPQCPVPSTDDIDEDAQWSIFTTERPFSCHHHTYPL